MGSVRASFACRWCVGQSDGPAVSGTRLLVRACRGLYSVGNFAVFNIADASITVGVIVFILAMLTEERRAKNEQGSTDSAGTGGK